MNQHHIDHPLLAPLKQLHHAIRTAVVAACENAELEAMSAIASDGAGDTIYAVDRISEALLIDFFSEHIAPIAPIILVAEGLEEAEVVVPAGASPTDAKWRIIVDPIDGTRGLMYQKRSAWILTAVAPNRGPATSLNDVEFAIQTEIPINKQHLSDQVWAQRGKGIAAVRYNRLTEQEQPLQLRPSQSPSIAHGFASIARFFPGVREELSAIDEEVVMGALGPVEAGKTHCFEDQYISTGGQLYELMAGHDRFIADIRPVMEQLLTARGLALGICCHPYDICTALIAEELGVVITDEHGNKLDCPLDLASDVSWVGYANPIIEKQIAPLLTQALRQRGLLN